MNFPYSKQKWVALSLATIILASGNTVIAAGTQAAPAPHTQQETPAPAANQVEILTLDKAVEEAIANNSSLKALRIEVQTKDVNARLVKAQVKEIPDDFIDSLDSAKQTIVQKASVEMVKKVNQLALYTAEKNVKIGVQKAYYDLLDAQDSLKLKEQSLKRAQLSLQVANASFQAGTRAKTEVLQAQAGVAGAEAELSAAQSEVEIKRLELNKILGADLMKKWTLSSKPSQVKVETINVEEAVGKAHKERVEIEQKTEEVKLAELNVEMIRKYSALSTWPGQMAQNDLEKGKLAVEDEKVAITVNVMQSYYNLTSAKIGAEALKKAKEAQAENYRLTNLRFENGLATTLEVLSAEEQLSKSELSYQEAIHRYNLAVASYENAISK